jgi:hypothetical protein
MTHYFDKGVFTASTWHGLEQIGVMSTAEDMIEHGDQRPERLMEEFDAQAALDALEGAILAIKGGDGTAATGLAAEAFARLASFHKT